MKMNNKRITFQLEGDDALEEAKELPYHNDISFNIVQMMGDQ